MQAHSSHGIRVLDDAAAHTATLTPQNSFLTHSFVDQLRTQFGEIVGSRLDSGVSHIVVDLQNVTKADAAGLALLLALKKRADAHGATFRVTGLTTHVRRMVTLARADTALGV